MVRLGPVGAQRDRDERPPDERDDPAPELSEK
jgi:hypothetical protein